MGDILLREAGGDEQAERMFIERFLKKSPEHFNIVSKEVKKGQKIGKGSQSIVYKGTYQGQTVAIKRIFADKKEQQKYIKTEISILKAANHENVLKLLGLFHREKRELYGVVEYVDGGSLERMMRKSKQSYAPHVRLALLQQIIDGLAYLHGVGVWHRDLKPDNILVTTDWEKVKICDFGFSCINPKVKDLTNQDANPLPSPSEILQNDRSVYRKSIVGSRLFMSPELLKHSSYGASSDIYSYGLIAINVLSSKDLPIPKSQGYSEEQIQEMCSTLPVGQSLKDLIYNCLNPDPMKRPLAKDLLITIRELNDVARVARLSVLPERETINLATFDLDKLMEKILQPNSNFTLANHTQGLKSFAQSFQGRQLVDFIQIEYHLKNRIDAEKIGEMMYMKGYLSHVLFEATFLDSTNLYQFTDISGFPKKEFQHPRAGMGSLNIAILLQMQQSDGVVRRAKKDCQVFTGAAAVSWIQIFERCRRVDAIALVRAFQREGFIAKFEGTPLNELQDSKTCFYFFTSKKPEMKGFSNIKENLDFNQKRVLRRSISSGSLKEKMKEISLARTAVTPLPFEKAEKDQDSRANLTRSAAVPIGNFRQNSPQHHWNRPSADSTWHNPARPKLEQNRTLLLNQNQRSSANL